MRRVYSTIIVFCALLLLCGFSEADYALYVYFEDGDLYMRNNHASIITNDPGVYFHVDVRTPDYDYIYSTENIKLEVGETTLIMTEEELRSVAGDLSGILVHGNSNVGIWDDDFTNDLYYYFEETSANTDSQLNVEETHADAGSQLIVPVIIGIAASAITVLILSMWFGLRARRRKS